MLSRDSNEALIEAGERAIARAQHELSIISAPPTYEMMESAQQDREQRIEALSSKILSLQNACQILKSADADRTQQSAQQAADLLMQTQIYEQYLEITADLPQGPKQISEATLDMQKIISAMLDDKNKIEIEYNVLDELVIKIDSPYGSSQYNLTQIFAHDIDWSQIRLSDDEMKQYIDFLQNSPDVVKPMVNYHFPTETELNQKDKQQELTDLHYAEKCAINLYTNELFCQFIQCFLRNDGKKTYYDNESLKDHRSQKSSGAVSIAAAGGLKSEVTQLLLATVIANHGLSKSAVLKQSPRLLHRGEAGERMAPLLEKRKKEKRERAKSFTSTSKSLEKAKSFALGTDDKPKENPTLITFLNMTGRSIGSVSQHSKEEEISQPAGSTIRYVDSGKKQLADGRDVTHLLAFVISPLEENQPKYSHQVSKFRDQLIEAYTLGRQLNPSLDAKLLSEMHKLIDVLGKPESGKKNSLVNYRKEYKKITPLLIEAIQNLQKISPLDENQQKVLTQLQAMNNIMQILINPPVKIADDVEEKAEKSESKLPSTPRGSGPRSSIISRSDSIIRSPDLRGSSSLHGSSTMSTSSNPSPISTPKLSSSVSVRSDSPGDSPSLGVRFDDQHQEKSEGTKSRKMPTSPRGRSSSMVSRPKANYEIQTVQQPRSPQNDSPTSTKAPPTEERKLKH